MQWLVAFQVRWHTLQQWLLLRKDGMCRRDLEEEEEAEGKQKQMKHSCPNNQNMWQKAGPLLKCARRTHVGGWGGGARIIRMHAWGDRSQLIAIAYVRAIIILYKILIPVGSFYMRRDKMEGIVLMPIAGGLLLACLLLYSLAKARRRRLRSSVQVLTQINNF